MAGHNTLEGKNGIIALKMLKEVTDLLDDNNIEYWLEGGTLLGVIRENRLLPWDNDMDISIDEKYYDKLVQVIEKSIYRVRFREFTEDNIPFAKGVKRIVKITNKKLFFFKGDVTLEIFIKFKNKENTYWQVGQKRKFVPSYFYENTIKYNFDNKEYLVPKLYDEYLTYRYGDWKTPVKEWNTFTDDKALDTKK